MRLLILFISVFIATPILGICLERWETARITFQLAQYYYHKSYYIEAIQFSEKATELYDDPNKPDWAKKNDLLKIKSLQAMIYLSMGENPANVLPPLEEEFNVPHGDKSVFLNINLAQVNLNLKKYDKALEYINVAFALMEEVVKKHYSGRTPATINLSIATRIKSRILSALHEYDKSTIVLENYMQNCKPRSINESVKWNKSLRDRFAASLKNPGLGYGLRSLTNILDESAYEDLLNNVNELAMLYILKKEYSKCVSLYNQFLKYYENIDDNYNPSLSLAYHLLAVSYHCEGKNENAAEYAIKEIEAKKKELDYIFKLDEYSRLNWQNNTNLTSFWASGIIPKNIFVDYILNVKGVILDSIITDKKVQTPVIKWAAKKKADFLKRSSGVKDETLENKFKIGSLERDIISEKYKKNRSTLNLTIDDITPSLAGGGVLVDFFQFDDPKCEGDKATCIGVIITTEDKQSNIVVIQNRNEIHKSISDLRSAITEGREDLVLELSSSLYDQLWAPIEANIPVDAKHIFLSPDGNLNFLSFGTLIDGGGSFLAERFPITYIGSSRDLTGKHTKTTAKTIAIYANPDFDNANFDLKSVSDFSTFGETANFSKVSFSPLPGTMSEASNIKKLAQKTGWQINLMTGRLASESKMPKHSPSILHFATHGFYLNHYSPYDNTGVRGMVVSPKQQSINDEKTWLGVDPMRASGIALSGASKTFALWAMNKSPDPNSDGVLTAEEVATLDLSNTWMVVLSACETGVGKATSGEGVFGLRRAFKIAGVDNIIMTLWPVNDQITAEFMNDFYKEVLETCDAPSSLAKVQREWLVKLRYEHGILHAIRNIGPFVISR